MVGRLGRFRLDRVLRVGIEQVEVVDVEVDPDPIAARESCEGIDVVVEDDRSRGDRLQPDDRGVMTWVTLCGNGRGIDPAETGVLQVRWRGLPGPFLAIVDRRRAFFAPAVHHGEPYGIVINDDILTLVLHWFYLTLMWLPCEQLYVDPDRDPTYISIEAFILDVAPLWHDGATIRVRVLGQRPATGESTAVRGTLEYINAAGGTAVPRDPPSRSCPATPRSSSRATTAATRSAAGVPSSRISRPR